MLFAGLRYEIYVSGLFSILRYRGGINQGQPVAWGPADFSRRLVAGYGVVIAALTIR